MEGGGEGLDEGFDVGLDGCDGAGVLGSGLDGRVYWGVAGVWDLLWRWKWVGLMQR